MELLKQHRPSVVVTEPGSLSGIEASMKITRDVIVKIESLREYSDRECGAVLGSSDGEVIDFAELDVPQICDRFAYSPDIGYLNKVIAGWRSCGIEFRGLLHTHLFDVPDLSESDRVYIDTIIRAAPDGYDGLLFPVFVLPDARLLAYYAERTAGGAGISPCSVSIV